LTTTLLPLLLLLLFIAVVAAMTGFVTALPKSVEKHFNCMQDMPYCRLCWAPVLQGACAAAVLSAAVKVPWWQK
jgi:hypothetical protein